MTYYIILFLISVLVSSFSQVLLKSSANKAYGSKIKEYLNLKVISAYIMFFGATLITVIAYRRVPLTLGPILESVGYVFVAVLSYLFLKERISRRKCIGLAIIMIGVVVANI